MKKQEVNAFCRATHLYTKLTVYKQEIFAQFKNEFFHVLKQAFMQMMFIMFFRQVKKIHYGFVL